MTHVHPTRLVCGLALSFSPFSAAASAYNSIVMDVDANLLNPKAEAYLPVGATAVGKSGATAKVKGIARRTESAAPTPAASEATTPAPPVPAAPVSDAPTVLDDYDRARREIFDDAPTDDAVDGMGAPAVPAEGRKKVALRGSVDKDEEGQFDRRVLRGRGRGGRGVGNFRGGRGSVETPYQGQFQHPHPIGQPFSVPFGPYAPSAVPMPPQMPAPYGAAPGPYPGPYPHPMPSMVPSHHAPLAPPMPMPMPHHFAPHPAASPYGPGPGPVIPSMPSTGFMMGAPPHAPFPGQLPPAPVSAVPGPQPFPSVPGFVPPTLPPGAQLTPAQWEHLMKAAGGPRQQ
jgi:hypothetical protein